MFDFIPLDIYTAVFFNAMLIISFLILLHSFTYSIDNDNTIFFSNILGYIFLFVFIFYIGTRPVSYTFGDMGTYARVYKKLEQGETVIVEKDYLFNYFMVASSKIMNDRLFFFVCSLLYVVPCWLFSAKYFKSYWFFAFFMMVSSFMYWPYGTNGIRNGIATSLFILALNYYDRKIVMYAIMLLAFGFHNSLMITIVAFIISVLYKNPKIYIYIWLATIPLSLVGGNFWGGVFSGIGFGDSRASEYLDPNAISHLAKSEKTTFAHIGFRWDFLLYSAFAVFAGYYFIFKKKIEDKFYIHLWGTYTVANAFWILVIRAAFSNRFAYLSWFLMSAVIAYPLFKYKVWNDQYKAAGIIMVIYFMFSYMLFLKGSL